jgi:hypothetical protein
MTPTDTPTSTPTACQTTIPVGNSSDKNQSNSVAASFVNLISVVIGGSGLAQVSDVQFDVEQAAPTTPQINVGIYADTGSSHPGALIANSGVVSYAVGMNKVSFSPRVYLSPGTYWIGVSPVSLALNMWFGATGGGNTYIYSGSLPSDLSISSPTLVPNAIMQIWLDYCQ